MNALITGATGFAGGHMVEFLARDFPHVELHGTYFSHTPRNSHYELPRACTLHECDMNDKARLKDLIAEITPHIVIHLAAQSYVGSSWENPELTLHTNIIGQSNLFEGIRALRSDVFDPTVVIACSSEEYGLVSHDTPLTEESPLKPQSPYALSKVAQDYMGFQYWKAYGMKIIRIRSFNHTGPRRDPVFGVSGFCKKIAEIEKGLRPPQLEVRDLRAVRDFSDVRDIVRAYWRAAEACMPGEVYNVCSGNGHSFQKILETLLSLSSVPTISLIPDPHGKRPTDGGVLVGDNSKFNRITGWSPRIDFLSVTLPDLLNYWRNSL